MSGRAGDLLYSCILVFCTFNLVCVHGRDGGRNPSCEVALLVQRGKTLVAPLGETTTLECLVDHCRKSIKVNWCKGDKCVAIIPNANVEITETGVNNDRMVSSLIFKRISAQDAGFYRCYVKDNQDEEISHAIEVQVSASNPSCEAALLVKRGTIAKAAPGERTTLKCPVQTCGKSVKVTWCKGRDQCVDITPTDNLEMTQTSSNKNNLHSYLTFKKISLVDAGHYKCYINDNQGEEISHAIEVQVSGEDRDPATDDDVAWLPFLLIGIGVAALVCIVIVVPVIKGYCQKRTRTFSPAQRQEMSTHTIPGLPPRSAPTAFVQQNQPMFFSSPSSELPVNMGAHQPEGVMYSGINHRPAAPVGGYFY